MMKVVHICLCGPFNEGWGYQENLLTKYHHKMGLDVTIIATPFINDKQTIGIKYVGPCEKNTDDGCKLIRLDKIIHNNRLNYTLGVYRGLYQTIDAENPDILFVHGCQFLGAKAVCKYARMHSSVRLYVDNHSDQYISAKNILSRLLKHKIMWRAMVKCLNPVTSVFWGVTYTRCDYLVNMYHAPLEKVKLLVMGADDEELKYESRNDIRKNLRNQFSFSKDDFVVLTGGKMDYRKNVHLLMDAIIEIDNPHVKLMIVGVPDDEFKQEFEHKCTNVHIKNIGWINADSFYDYCYASDLVVFPGMHSVMWEQAIATGSPCVFKKLVRGEHIDIGGNCCYLYDNSSDEIQQVILDLYHHPKKIEQMKSAALSETRETFLYSNIARRSIEWHKYNEQ